MGWHIDGGMGSCQDIKLFELYKTELNMVCVCDVEFECLTLRCGQVTRVAPSVPSPHHTLEDHTHRTVLHCNESDINREVYTTWPSHSHQTTHI
jgi:hypothetical protein